MSEIMVDFAKSTVDPKKMVWIGRDLYLIANIWNKEPRVSIRQFFMKQTNEYFPTKLGVTLTSDEFQKILDSGDKIKSQINELTKGKSKSKRKTIKLISSSESDHSDSDSDKDVKKRKKKY